MLPGGLDHPSFETALSTAVSGLLLLAVLFAVLFVLPYAIFTLL